jgi:hypothetical protein
MHAIIVTVRAGGQSPRFAQFQVTFKLLPPCRGPGHRLGTDSPEAASLGCQWAAAAGPGGRRRRRRGAWAAYPAGRWLLPGAARVPGTKSGITSNLSEAWQCSDSESVGRSR